MEMAPLGHSGLAWSPQMPGTGYRPRIGVRTCFRRYDGAAPGGCFIALPVLKIAVVCPIPSG